MIERTTVRERDYLRAEPEPLAPRLRVVRASPPMPRLRRSARIDTYFRRDDTRLARALARFSAPRGGPYLASGGKRALDIAIGLPAALIAAPIILVLLALNRLVHPRYPALFTQDRVGYAESTLRIAKIRSLTPAQGESGYASGTTAFGRFLRRHYLDEMPQLFQVLLGQLSLVGIRVLPPEVHDGLCRSWSHQRYDRWRTTYSEARLGLTGVHQVLRGPGKEDERRFWRDTFYSRRASLGFDLYLLWRTLSRERS